MGARPYDPSLGRFLAVDPVDGGSINNYDYAGQDPINGYDLAGLYEESGQVVEGGDAGEDGGSGESESDAIRDQALKGALTEEEDATYENVIGNGNKMGHIFDPKHELDGLFSALGGEANVVRQVVMNLGKIGSQEGDFVKSNGEYSILRTVAGVTLRITGKIMSNGAVKLGNFWVPT